MRIPDSIRGIGQAIKGLWSDDADSGLFSDIIKGVGDSWRGEGKKPKKAVEIKVTGGRSARVMHEVSHEDIRVMEADRWIELMENASEEKSIVWGDKGPQHVDPSAWGQKEMTIPQMMNQTKQAERRLNDLGAKGDQYRRLANGLGKMAGLVESGEYHDQLVGQAGSLISRADEVDRLAELPDIEAEAWMTQMEYAGWDNEMYVYLDKDGAKLGSKEAVGGSPHRLVKRSEIQDLCEGFDKVEEGTRFMDRFREVYPTTP